MTPQRQHEDIIERQKTKILNIEKMLDESERLRIRGEQYLYSLFNVAEKLVEIKGMYFSDKEMRDASQIKIG